MRIIALNIFMWALHCCCSSFSDTVMHCMFSRKTHTNFIFYDVLVKTYYAHLVPHPLQNTNTEQHETTWTWIVGKMKTNSWVIVHYTRENSIAYCIRFASTYISVRRNLTRTYFWYANNPTTKTYVRAVCMCACGSVLMLLCSVYIGGARKYPFLVHNLCRSVLIRWPVSSLSGSVIDLYLWPQFHAKALRHNFDFTILCCFCFFYWLNAHSAHPIPIMPAK